MQQQLCIFVEKIINYCIINRFSNESSAYMYDVTNLHYIYISFWYAVYFFPHRICIQM